MMRFSLSALSCLGAHQGGAKPAHDGGKCILGGTGRDSGDRPANKPAGQNLARGCRESRTKATEVRSWKHSVPERKGQKGLNRKQKMALRRNHSAWELKTSEQPGRAESTALRLL